MGRGQDGGVRGDRGGRRDDLRFGVEVDLAAVALGREHEHRGHRVVCLRLQECIPESERAAEQDGEYDDPPSPQQPAEMVGDTGCRTGHVEFHEDPCLTKTPLGVIKMTPAEGLYFTAAGTTPVVATRAVSGIRNAIVAGRYAAC